LSAVSRLPVGDAYDPTSATYFVGRSTYENDAQSYTARGGELGITWNAFHGLDLRLSSALQSVVADSPQQQACGPCSQAPALKLNAGLVYRTPVGLDLSADFSYVSGTTWVERQPAPSDPTQIQFVSNWLADYTVLNARVAYRFFDDRLTVAVVGSQLGPNHQEHPLGNMVSRRIFATLSVRP
jgi:hypothetical protein